MYFVIFKAEELVYRSAAVSCVRLHLVSVSWLWSWPLNEQVPGLMIGSLCVVKGEAGYQSFRAKSLFQDIFSADLWQTPPTNKSLWEFDWKDVSPLVIIHLWNHLLRHDKGTRDITFTVFKVTTYFSLPSNSLVIQFLACFISFFV